MEAELLQMPERNRDSDTGRYTSKYTADEFKGTIRDLGGAGGTQEIADALNCNYNTAYSKLRQLEDSGEVESRKVANARLWSVAED